MKRLALLTPFVLYPSFALAFHTPLHLDITYTALSQVGLDSATIAEINAGNERTDTVKALFNRPECHFDGESFAAGSARLTRKFNAAINHLKSCEREKALDEIGTSLHMIQDFFAHSNFIEMNASDPNAQINLFELRDPPSGAVCSPGNFGNVLTSGYFPDKPRRPGKCMHSDLNKDSPEVGPRHFAARARAVAESVKFLRAIENALRTRFGSDGNRIITYLHDSSSTERPGTHCSQVCTSPPSSINPRIFETLFSPLFLLL